MIEGQQLLPGPTILPEGSVPCPSPYSQVPLSPRAQRLALASRSLPWPHHDVEEPTAKTIPPKVLFQVGFLVAA